MKKKWETQTSKKDTFMEYLKAELKKVEKELRELKL